MNLQHHLDSLEPEAGRYPRSRRTSILLCEDDEEFRAMLRDVLVDRGYAVVEARDGGEALRAMSFIVTDEGLIAEPDLVISDVRMPRKDGLELAERLAIYAVGVPVLLMSAFADDSMRDSASQNQVVAVLSKPFPLARFLDIVSALAPA